MKVLALIPVLAAGSCFAETYWVRTIDVSPGIVASWATHVTNDGRVTGASEVESGRRTLGFVWRDGVIEQLVVPQAGSFAARPRSFDIHHHVVVLGMTPGGYYCGFGENVSFTLASQPYFAWLPSTDPYPSEFVAAENVGNAYVCGIADTTPFITAVGVGTFRVNNADVRQGFITRLSQADDDGNPIRMTVLTGFAGPSSFAAAFAVNNAGDVVGYGADAQGYHRPMLVPASSGVMQDIGTLGGPSGEANAISDLGVIVGQADVQPGRPHAFVRGADGQVIDLGTLGGAVSSATAVNNSGVVVGESWTADGQVHACLWQGGNIVDLNNAIPVNGWVLTHASGINDSGVISGWGQYQGRTLAFVLEPASCTQDFNHDGDIGTDQDIDAFFACLGGNCCSTCGSADFNGDGDVGTDADIESFFRVLGGGPC